MTRLDNRRIVRTFRGVYFGYAFEEVANRYGVGGVIRVLVNYF